MSSRLCRCVDIQRTVVSTVISERQIAELPIDRRNHISFAVLAAGVATDRTLNQGPAETSGLSFAGQSARANNITVDGLDNNDDATGGVRAVFSQDAVREFQVVVHSYSAEFGKAAGGVVNIVTRSGTNRVAADAFGFYRDRGLNSRGYFDNFDPSGAAVRLPKAPFKQQQFGGTLGGPVKKKPHVRLRLVRASFDSRQRRGDDRRSHGGVASLSDGDARHGAADSQRPPGFLSRSATCRSMCARRPAS